MINKKVVSRQNKLPIPDVSVQGYFYFLWKTSQHYRYLGK